MLLAYFLASGGDILDADIPSDPIFLVIPAVFAVKTDSLISY